jgi:hypothetical protein
MHSYNSNCLYTLYHSYNTPFEAHVRAIVSVHNSKLRYFLLLACIVVVARIAVVFLAGRQSNVCIKFHKNRSFLSQVEIGDIQTHKDRMVISPIITITNLLSFRNKGAPHKYEFLSALDIITNE